MRDEERVIRNFQNLVPEGEGEVRGHEPVREDGQALEGEGGGETAERHLKIAHFVYYGPKRAGMYETARDLCLAECELGHDAKLVDTSWVDLKEEPPQTFRYDRGLDVASVNWAADADVFVLHSRIPPGLAGKKPTVAVLHGAPEYVFYSELFRHKQGDGGYTTLIAYGKDESIRKFITFWPRHERYWKAILGDEKIEVVSAPVRASEFTPDGPEESFAKSGKFNLGFCDTWRPTFFKDPFQIIVGVRTFWQRFPDVRLQLFAIPTDRKRTDEWGGLWDRNINAIRAQGDFIGDIWQLHTDIAKVYRALDAIVTASVDASRVIREALSCGTPIVAPYGCPYTNYPCDIGDPSSVADSLCELRKDLEEKPEEVREHCLTTARQFSDADAARQFVAVLERVLEDSDESRPSHNPAASAERG